MAQVQQPKTSEHPFLFVQEAIRALEARTVATSGSNLRYSVRLPRVLRALLFTAKIGAAMMMLSMIAFFICHVIGGLALESIPFLVVLLLFPFTFGNLGLAVKLSQDALQAGGADTGDGTGTAAASRPIPPWEYAVYLLTFLLIWQEAIVMALQDAFPSQWPADPTLYTRLPQVELLLGAAIYPVGLVALSLSARRWRPEEWKVLRRLRGGYMLLIGVGFLFALAAWSSVLELATPMGQIPPDVPSILAVPAIAAGVLAVLGIPLAAVEVVLDARRTRRQS